VRIDILKSKHQGELKVQEELMSKNIESLDKLTLTIFGKANDKGHLFAGLHRDEIARELASQAHIHVDPSSIVLEHPIKEVGESVIAVKSGSRTAKFKLIIKAA